MNLFLFTTLDRLSFTTSLVLDLCIVLDTLTILGNQIFDYMIRRFRFSASKLPL